MVILHTDTIIDKVYLSFQANIIWFTKCLDLLEKQEQAFRDKREGNKMQLFTKASIRDTFIHNYSQCPDLNAKNEQNYIFCIS